MKLKNEKTDKKWLLESIIFQQTGIGAFVIMTQIFHVFKFSDNFLESNNADFVFAIAFTLLALLNYISLELLPSKAEQLINETYPEFYL